MTRPGFLLLLLSQLCFWCSGSRIPSSWTVHAGCVLLPAFTCLGHGCQDLLSPCNGIVHRLGLGLYSHPKEFWGNGVRTHVNSTGKNPLYQKLRGGSNLRRCITQDSEPNTLPTELFRSPAGISTPSLEFSGSSHTSDSKIGTPVATLPGAWRYRVSAGTGRPGVSIL